MLPEKIPSNKSYLIESLVQGLVLTSNHIVILGTDADGTIKLVNPAIRKTFGYLEGEIEGKGLSFLIPELESIEYENFNWNPHSGELELFAEQPTEEDHWSDEDKDPANYNYIKRFLYGKTKDGVKEEILTKRKDGSPIWIDLTIEKSHLSSKHDHIYSVVIIDITLLKEKEEEALQCEREKRALAQQMLEEAGRQNRILEAMSRTQRLILNTSEGVIIGANGAGEIQLINPSVRRVFGYFEGEVEGKQLSFLVPELEILKYDSFDSVTDSGELELFELEDYPEEPKAGPPEHKPEEYDYLERFLFGKTESRIKQEVLTKRKDGTELWIRLSINRVLADQEWIYSIYINDITEQKEKEKKALQLEQEKVKMTEEMLRASEEQNRALEELSQSMRLVLNTAQGVIIGLDGNRVIHGINPAVRKVFGYLEGEVEGKELSFLIPELETLEYDNFSVMADMGELELFLDDEQDESLSNTDAVEEHDYMERFIFGECKERPKGEIQTRQKDGHALWIEMSVNRILTDTGFSYSVFINDITERKLKEQETLRLEQEKVKMTEEMLRVTEEHNRTLELKVQKRTADIKALMDNTGQGFLSFASDYKIHSQYSRACEHFFQKPIADLDALDLLFGPSCMEQVKDVIDVLFMGVAKLHQISELLPNEVNCHEFVLSIEYRWIEAVQEGDPSRVMMILTDITKQKELAKQLQKDEEYKEMITKVAINRDDFCQLSRLIFQMMEDMEALFKKSPDEVDITTLFRWYHSIKGGAASYGMKAVSQRAHSIESGLEIYRQGEKAFDRESLQTTAEETMKLKQELFKTLEELSDLVSIEDITETKECSYKVPEHKIKALEESLQPLQQIPEVSQIQKEIENLRKQPIGKILKKFASDAKDLAFDLGKEVEVKLNGMDQEIDYAPYKELFGTLIHLIRNSVDHGIEDPQTRVMLEKSETGLLNLSAVVNAKSLTLSISDDGGGINHERIRTIAISKGIISEKESTALSDQEALALIFAPGFSTKEQVSDISGRGVGMDAVKASVNDLNGTIDIKTEIDKGTTFTIALPLLSL